MGNFNGNALAQKFPKKAKNRTCEHYISIYFSLVFDNKGLKFK